MRKLIYLVFNGGTIHASFTRPSHFDPHEWAVMHTPLLHEIGVANIEFEEVADDFYLPWEKI